MKEHELRQQARTGIVFSTPLIRQIERGYKTQTRRVTRGKPPVYTVGDVLYIKETWQAYSPFDRAYRSYSEDGRKRYLRHEWDTRYRAIHEEDQTIRWNSARFMPRFFARLFIKVLAVDEQPLWAITDEDARAEGVVVVGSTWEQARASTVEAFPQLWDSINAKAGFPYESNPQVYRYKFELIPTEPTTIEDLPRWARERVIPK